MLTVGFNVEDNADNFILDFLKINESLVVSSYIDMSRIDPQIAKHELNVNALANPIK